MPKLRNQIRMSDAEAWEFVGAQRDMHVATLNKDGTAQLTTNWFAVVDGRVIFNTYESSQKIVNLRRDPRITLLFAAGERYRELRGVSMKGVARMIEDPKENLRLLQVVYERNKAYVDPEVTGGTRPADRASKRVTVSVHPERLISWDHGKLPAVASIRETEER